MGGGKRHVWHGVRWMCVLSALTLGLACEEKSKPTDVPRPSDRDDQDSEEQDDDVEEKDAGTPEDKLKSCDEKALSLGWPVQGDRGVSWEITHYFDLDPSANIADYTGAKGAAAKTYDGHPGIDVSIADFRAMDQGIDVLAVADGVVVDVTDGFFDRVKVMDQPACNAVQNFIVIEEPRTGYRHEYLHIRKGSTKVRIGDSVKRGDAIALVGSAGCSVGPHVHLNIIDCDMKAIDPFKHGLFEQAPSYDAQLRLMSSLLTNATIAETDDIADPGVDLTTMSAGDPLGIGIVLGAGNEADSLSIVLKRPDASTFGSVNRVLGAVPRLTYAFWNVVPDASAGMWTLDVLHAGVSLGSRQIQVTRKLNKTQHLVLDVSADDLDATVADEAKLGFYPRIIDGYRNGDDALFNLVFDNGPVRQLRVGMTVTTMDAARTLLATSGLSPVQIDAYSTNEGARYAAVFAALPDVVSYFGLSSSEHNQGFSEMISAGRMPLSIAIAGDSGMLRVAASYIDNPDLTFEAHQGVTPEFLDMYSATESSKRRFPSHMHATDWLPDQRHTVTWTSWDPGDHVLTRDLTQEVFLAQHAVAQGAGLVLAELSATTTENGVRYAALWLMQARTAF